MRFDQVSIIIFSVTLFFSCNNSNKTSILNQQQDSLVDSLVVDSSTIDSESFVERIEPTIISNTLDIGWKFDSLWADSIIYPEGDTTKRAFSFQVSIIYPTLSPVSENLDAIQRAFVKIISKSDTLSIQKAFEQQVDKLIDTAQYYEEEESEVPGFSYHDSYSFSIEYISDKIITISSFISIYRGGFHNVFGIYYSNVSTSTGNILDEKELFKSGTEKQLTKLIQDEIERRNNSKDEDKHIALLVNLDKISSNNNFVFENTGITYIYNVYEITGFAYGIVELHLTYDKIIPLVKEKYVSLIRDLEKEKIYEIKSIRSEDGILIRE